MAGQTSPYWGNTNYATTQQQAQYAGMPSQQNYQSPPSSQAPTGSGGKPLWQPNAQGGGYSYVGPGSTAATQQGSPWATPSQGSWGGGSQAQPSAQTNWNGGGGWGTPPPAAPQTPPSFALPGGGTDWQAQLNWYNTHQGSPAPGGGTYNGGAQGGTYVPDGSGHYIYVPYQAPSPGQPGQPGQMPPQIPPSWWQQPQGPQQGGPGGMQAPPPGHDTNGYQSPQAVQPPASRFAMPGWDNQKWNDPNNQDPKYVVGRILSNLPGRTDQMDTAVQRIQAAYPGSQRVGQGDISIPGVGVIDILMKSSTGGSGWWWGAGGGGGGQQQAPAQSNPNQAWPGGPDIQTMMRLLQGGQTYAPQQQVQQQPMPDISQYTSQIQRLQTQLAELQAGQNQQRGLNVTYF